jgi:hypothetical protein
MSDEQIEDKYCSLEGDETAQPLDFCLENMRYNDDEINTVNFVNVQE